MTLARTLAAIALLATIAMGALWAVGVHLVENGDPAMGSLAMIAGMFTAIPVVVTAMLAIEAHQFGTLS